MSPENLRCLISSRAVVVVHFDAEWNGYRAGVRKLIRDAQVAMADQVAFAEVDVDFETELAKAIKISQVPSVAYYRNGVLSKIVAGAKHNILDELQRLLSDDQTRH